jgi:adenine-specific DNA-methyltransferase
VLPKEKLAFYQRARQLRPLASELPNGAARLTDTVLVAWLKARYPLLSRKNLHFGKSLYVEPKVQALAAWLRERDLLESIFWLSSAYALWVGAEVRDAHAMFFTPPELSTRLIENLESNGAEFAQHVFIDPACGGAAFLAPLAVWMRAELAKKGLSLTAILRHIQSHLLGAEIDSTLCRISEFFLRMALYDDIVSAGIEPKFNIRLGDSLKVLEKLYGRIDVVICNPLYRKMKPTEVDLYRKVYGDFIEGQPNLYGLFFGLTLKLLKHDGIAGLLTPTSFLSGQYFSKLRTCLLTHADTPQLDIIGKRLGVFIGVEQETAITVLKKRALQKVAPSSSRVFVFAPSSRAFQDVGTCALPDSGSAWPVPRKPSDTETIQAVSGSRFHLTDYGYKARVGAFVWNRDKRKKFKSEAEARCNGRAIYPLIWSSDICQDGSFVFNREKDEKHTPFVDMERPECTSILCRPCVALQRVTSSDQARRLVAAPHRPKAFR